MTVENARDRSHGPRACIRINVSASKKDRPVESIRVLSVIPLIALLSACASTGIDPSPRELNAALTEITQQNGRVCVRQRDITGFAALSDSLVSVSNRTREHYLMVTRFRCPDMEMAPAALFEGAFTEFCGQRDSITTRGGRCPVQSVFEFDNRDAAFAALDRAEEMIARSRE